MEEDYITTNLSYLEETDFFDKLIVNPTKISTKINQNKLLNFLENSLFALENPNQDQEEFTKMEKDKSHSFKNLDEYQMWGIIENLSKDLYTDLNKKLKNENYHKDIIKEIKVQNLSLNQELLKLKRNSDDNKNNKEDEIDNEDMVEEMNEDDLSLEEKKEKSEKKLKREKFLKDKFFDMEEFNNIGEDDMNDLNLDEDDENDYEESEGDFDKNMLKENENDEDESGEDEAKGENKGIKYNDFFDDERIFKKAKGKKYETEEILDEDIEDNIFDLENKFINKDKEGIKAQYEFDDDNNFENFDAIEKNMMEKKNWAMKGEVKAKERPKESLLENYLDFQVSVKAPPIPSNEMSNAIEKMIKLRIKDDLYDDPIRQKTINLNKREKQEIELDFDKSKKGLGDIYEDEYNEVTGNANEAESKELYKEIDDLTNKLYTIFDKLTNNNFVSGNRNIEMKVITNIPSIQLEDISNFVSDNKAYSKSANEIYSRKDLETKTKDEMTKEEKETLHKHTKRNIRNKLRENEKKRKMKMLMGKLDSKFEAKFALKQMKDKNAKKNISSNDLKSSKFFGNLQNIANDDRDKKNTKSNLRNAQANDEFGNKNPSAKNFKF